MPAQLPDDDETVDVDPAVLHDVRTRAAASAAKAGGARHDDETVDVDPMTLDEARASATVPSAEPDDLFDNDETISVDPAVLGKIRMRAAGPFGASEAPNVAGPSPAVFPQRPRSGPEQKAPTEPRAMRAKRVPQDSRSRWTPDDASPSGADVEPSVAPRPTRPMEPAERGDLGPWKPPPRLRGGRIAKTEASLTERPPGKSGVSRWLVVAAAIAAVVIAAAAVLLFLAFFPGGDSDEDRSPSDPDLETVEVDGSP